MFLYGMGKSSVIQALLLLRQSFRGNYRAGLDCLYTNVKRIPSGTAEDIFCQSADSEWKNTAACENPILHANLRRKRYGIILI